MRKIICVLFLLVGVSLSAQEIAVKTNLLYDASTTINLGTEIGLSPKWTLDLSANYNGWTFSENKKWKHWMAQPEARYWLCEGKTPVRGLVCRRRSGLRLPVAAGQALEH